MEKDIESYEAIFETLEEMDPKELVEINNGICEIEGSTEAASSNMIYTMDQFNEVFKDVSPSDIVEMVTERTKGSWDCPYGSFSVYDRYFNCGYYEALFSSDDPMEFIDIDYLANFVDYTHETFDIPELEKFFAEDQAEEPC